jgi:hypothetical protein
MVQELLLAFSAIPETPSRRSSSAHQRLRAAGQRGDHHFGRFLAHFLRDLATPLGMEPGDIAGIRIPSAARGNGRLETGEQRGWIG